MAIRTEQQLAIERLRQRIRPGATIYCVLRHVSRSGLTRVVDLLTVEQGDIIRIGYDVALALGWPYDRRRGGVRVSGTGMDAGFHIVHSLAHVLGQTDGEGGYSLHHRWI